MKLLVETTGSFQLLVSNDPDGLVHFNRPSVVFQNHFLQSRVAAGQASVLGSLTDEATDEEFGKAWEANPDKAVETFLAKYTTERVAKAARSGPKAAKVAEPGEGRETGD